jgi:hypothetical protein
MAQKRGSTKKEKWNSKTVNTSVFLGEADTALLDWLVEFFGSNRSEVIRTCVRSLALALQSTQGGKR